MSDDQSDHEAELLGELRRLARTVDPVPEDVTAFARAALGWRRVDSELAELLADSRLDTESLARSEGDSGRLLSFRAADLELDLELRETDRGIVILGQLAPATPAQLDVQRDDRATLATGSADDVGRFRLELTERGRVRLVVRRDPHAAPVETSWFDAP